MFKPLQQSHRLAWLLGLTIALGALLFLWRLGAVGQLDETPALFAAAGRAMADSGDWLTPRVNGHPRFDKPVLIYWLIGGLSLLPR
ncbi:MAG: glycosyltransferase family 39 protein, partial [Synechococcaceae bacterium WBB_32_011]|nr:glycosyltransferase family 39 protein [Synechococcaceae bacterium WBB_32_011]